MTAPAVAAPAAAGVGTVVPVGHRYRRSGPGVRGLVTAVLLCLGGGVLVAHGATTIPASLDDALHPVPRAAAPSHHAKTPRHVVKDNRVYTLALPASAGAWRRIPAVGRYRGLPQSFGNAPGDGLGRMQAALYARGATPGLVLAVARHRLPADDNDAIFHALAESVAQAGGLLVLTHAVSHGLPGEMRCGNVNRNGSGTLVPMCTWVDHRTIGMVFVLPGTSGQPAALANELRRHAEHVHAK